MSLYNKRVFKRPLQRNLELPIDERYDKSDLLNQLDKINAYNKVHNL